MSDIEQIKSAIRHGAVWDGFSGPTGVTKDEALALAAELVDMYEALEAQSQGERAEVSHLIDIARAADEGRLAAEARAEAAERRAKVAEENVGRLMAAIEDIDAHATPLGEDVDDFVSGGYAVSVGCLHRALAMVRGGLPAVAAREEGS